MDESRFIHINPSDLTRPRIAAVSSLAALKQQNGLDTQEHRRLHSRRTTEFLLIIVVQLLVLGIVLDLQRVVFAHRLVVGRQGCLFLAQRLLRDNHLLEPFLELLPVEADVSGGTALVCIRSVQGGEKAAHENGRRVVETLELQAPVSGCVPEGSDT